MYAFGNMVWATMGPMNELFHEAMQDTSGAVSPGRPVLQSREPRARQPRHGHVRGGRPRRGHARRKPTCWWASCSRRRPTPPC